MRVKTIRNIACPILLLLFSVSATAQTAASVLQKYMAYTGGAARWKGVQTIVATGTYDYNGVVFPFTSYARRPDHYKYIVPFKGKYFAQAFDGTRGWKIDAFKGETKKTLLEGADARAMLNEADVELEPPFLAYEQKGHQAVLDGEDTVANKRCYKITFTRASGETETYFFDAANGALLKKIAPSKNSELQGAVLETTYSDYRNIAGLRLPFKAVSKTGGQPVLTIIVKKITFNKPVSEKIFKP